MSASGASRSGPMLPSEEQHQPFDSSDVKLTRGTSCVLCQQRKVRCDKNKPCANCIKAKVECFVVPPHPPRRRKKRLQGRDLIDRLKKYEALLSEHGIKFEPMGHELRSGGPPIDAVEDLENGFHDLKTSPDTSVSPSAASAGEKLSSSIFALDKEFRANEKLVEDSSDDEFEGSTIHRAFDKFFSNDDGFPFIVGASSASVMPLHPNPIQIFQLWQLYIDNVNSLLKITHVPTIQPQILQAASNLDKVPKNIEAFMFGVYVMAITSMEERHAQSMFSESKQQLLTRYLPATQQALVNAEFMRVDDPLVLQAFVLYLFAVRWFVDPRQLFCIIGVAVRNAQRMGLHRDPEGYGLPPFEIEQRRRLWWTIVGYDRRIGEMTGSTVTALSSGGDCKIPLNINDSDLHIDGKEMPTSHTGPTEMLFALSRIEFFMTVASNNRQADQRGKIPESKACPSKGDGRSTDTGPIIRLATSNSPTYTLDGFCAHIEGTYLSQCDPKIPLHFLTLTMARQALCKMRVINFLVRMHNAGATPLREVERDDIFLQATQMIEYDSMIQSSESLAPFRWYSGYYFPFPAYMFLLQDLRRRVSGPMADRAWAAITANYNLWGFPDNVNTPMHTAFRHNFIKAWNAYESAQRAAGMEVSTPRFIALLQEYPEQRRKERGEKQQGSEASSAFNFKFDNLGMKPGAPPHASMDIGGGPPLDDAGDMDWSYMAQGYQDPSAPFNDFGDFVNFGPPMGGGGPPMFGN